jgi:hypothetical protein
LKKLSHILPNHTTWLAGAVILYLLSFLFTQSFSPGRSIKNEIRELENFVRSKHKEFNTLVADTSLIKRLAFNTYSKKEVDEFTSSKYSTGIFVYKKDFGGGELKFWNNQISFPPNEIFSYPDTAYFEQRPNGFYICLKSTFGLRRQTRFNSYDRNDTGYVSIFFIISRTVSVRQNRFFKNIYLWFA